MGRSRRLAVDQDGSWIYRVYYDAALPEDSSINHDADYIVLSPGGGDDPAYPGISTPLFSGLGQGTQDIVLWANGVVSLGSVTQDQIDFMNGASSGDDMTGFPGQYIAAGFVTGADSVFIGIKSDHTEISFVVQDTGQVIASIVLYPDRVAVTSGFVGGGLDLGTGIAIVSDGSTTYDLRDLIIVNGTSGADILTGTSAPQTIFGLGGDDKITGSTGPIKADGGSGNDTLSAGSRSELHGGTGNDTITVASGSVADGGSGSDTITVALGPSGSPETIVTGGSGVDHLILDFGREGPGLRFALPPAAAGNGRFAAQGVTYTSIERFTLKGSLYNDTLIGSSGDDVLSGGYGADLLLGGAGNDTLSAGKGPQQSREPVLTAGGRDLASAVLLDNKFTQGAGGTLPFVQFDQVTDDLGHLNTDDFFTFTATTDGTILDVDLNQFTGSSDLAFYAITLFDGDGNVVATSDSNTWFSPGLEVSNLNAGRYYLEIASANQFSGSSTFETTISLSNALVPVRHDVLKGGSGNDHYYVYASDDVVIEKAGQGTDTVVSDVSWQLGANIENLQLAGTRATRGTGNELNNTITGNGASNTLRGQDGDDKLDGKAGADSMYGGRGDDRYVVDDQADRVVENAGEGTDTVTSSVSYTLSGSVENLLLAGTLAIDGTGNGIANQIKGNGAGNVLSGGGGRDILMGMGGRDTLDGGTNNDRLDGGTGNDLLRGGSGADTFVFTSTGLATSTRTSSERILDFSHAEHDLIDVSAIDANGAVAGDQAFMWIGKASFSGVAGQLRATVVDGNTYLLGDSNGDLKSDFLLRLDGVVDLVGADFVL